MTKPSQIAKNRNGTIDIANISILTLTVASAPRPESGTIYSSGDVVAFVDPAGGFFHAAVYLAGGLVFGKNGTSHLSPWSIVPMDRLKGYYLEHRYHWQTVYNRRNGT